MSYSDAARMLARKPRMHSYLYRTTFQPAWRDRVAKQLLAFADMPQAELSTTALALALFDRYADVAELCEYDLAPVAAACMFVAEKMDRDTHLDAECLCNFFAVNECTLFAAEASVCHRLGWELHMYTQVDLVHALAAGIADGLRARVTASAETVLRDTIMRTHVFAGWPMCIQAMAALCLGMHIHAPGPLDAAEWYQGVEDALGETAPASWPVHTCAAHLAAMYNVADPRADGGALPGISKPHGYTAFLPGRVRPPGGAPAARVLAAGHGGREAADVGAAGGALPA